MARLGRSRPKPAPPDRCPRIVTGSATLSATAGTNQRAVITERPAATLSATAGLTSAVSVTERPTATLSASTSLTARCGY